MAKATLLNPPVKQPEGEFARDCNYGYVRLASSSVVVDCDVGDLFVIAWQDARHENNRHAVLLRNPGATYSGMSMRFVPVVEPIRIDP